VADAGRKASSERWRGKEIDGRHDAAHPTTERGPPSESTDPREVDVLGDLVLAVPPKVLGGLVSPEVAARAPKLETVRLLRTEPMISLDLYFKRKILGLDNTITVLQDSNYTLSLLDNSQVWSDQAGRIRLSTSSRRTPI